MLFVCIWLLFLPLISANAFYFHVFFLVYWHIVCLFHELICIMHSAFILLVFLILCSHRCCFLQWKGYVLSGKIASNYIIYVIYMRLISTFTIISLLLALIYTCSWKQTKNNSHSCHIVLRWSRLLPKKGDSFAVWQKCYAGGGITLIFFNGTDVRIIRW